MINIKPAYIIVVVFLFFALSLVGMICEQLQPSAYYAAHTYEVGGEQLTKVEVVGRLFTFQWGSLITNPAAVFNAFMSMLFFDYSFFTGTWIWVRYIIFIPVGAAMAFLIVTGLISAVLGITGRIFGIATGR